MTDYLVLHVSRYDFQDRSGQVVRGVSVTYLDQRFEDKNSKGWAPLKVNADSSLWSVFTVVPGRYSLDFRQRPDSKGKPTLALTSASLSSPNSVSNFQYNSLDEIERGLMVV